MTRASTASQHESQPLVYYPRIWTIFLMLRVLFAVFCSIFTQEPSPVARLRYIDSFLYLAQMSDYPTTSPTTDRFPFRVSDSRSNNFFLCRKRLGSALSRICSRIWRNLCAAIVLTLRSLPNLYADTRSLLNRAKDPMSKLFFDQLALLDRAVLYLEDHLERVKDLASPACKAAWQKIAKLTLAAFEAALTRTKIFLNLASSRSVECLTKGIQITQDRLSTWTKLIGRVADDAPTDRILAAAALCVLAIGMFVTVAFGFRACWRLLCKLRIRLRG